MKRVDFKNRVVEHPDLEFLGMTLPTDEVVVKRLRDGAEIAVPWDDIPNHEWRDYEETFLGLREAHVMKGMSRIVGYFARIENWNASKIAELRDRHVGDYAVQDHTDPRSRRAWATH